nr:MAG TPA: hypothetical protein [Caudoviricetes sp.]
MKEKYYLGEKALACGDMEAMSTLTKSQFTNVIILSIEILL